MHLTEILFKCK